MNYVIFILASALIAYVLYTVIKDTVKDIKVLTTGSTLEKMQVLNIGLASTMMRKTMEKRIKRHKFWCHVTLVLGWLILLVVVGFVIFRLAEIQMGL